MLLVLSSMTSLNPTISLFLLLVVTTLLLCYMNYKHVYNSLSVLILENSFLLNLILLVGVMLYYSNNSEGDVYKMIALCVLIAIVFIRFCGIVLWSLLQICLKCRKQNCRLGDNVTMVDREIMWDQRDMCNTNPNSQFQDLILEDMPLLQDKD